MKLFAVYVGGELPGANIELHDMRFVAAPSILDTHDELRRQWWGASDSLHIDCWAEINCVDGYDVALRPQPYLGAEKLFYVNLGGYDRIDFAEKHKNLFVVADSVTAAKARALASVRHWQAAHRDDFYEAEQAFSLDKYARREKTLYSSRAKHRSQEFRIYMQIHATAKSREIDAALKDEPSLRGESDHRGGAGDRTVAEVFGVVNRRPPPTRRRRAALISPLLTLRRQRVLSW